MALPVLGFPAYQVYKDGRIWSTKTNKFLKPAYTKKGYASVELFNETGSKRLLIHRIVAGAYIPNPNKLPQVNHKDENPRNNDVSNLEWCTAIYNMNYGNGAKTRHSKIDYSKPCYRENAIRNGKKVCKAIAMYSVNGELVKEYESAAKASLETGIYKTSITRSARTERYKAGGYVWKYVKGE